MTVSWIHHTWLVLERLVRMFRFVVGVVSMLDISKYLCKIWQTVLGQHADVVNEACYRACSKSGQSQHQDM